LIGKNLQMLPVTDLFARIDIDPDRHENLAAGSSGEARFLTLNSMRRSARLAVDYERCVPIALGRLNIEGIAIGHTLCAAAHQFHHSQRDYAFCFGGQHHEIEQQPHPSALLSSLCRKASSLHT
jgi:hypothetical protein